MTESNVRLSSLGRKVCVGDLYNYVSDEILQLNPEQFKSSWKETKTENELKPESHFFFQVSDNLKYQILNIKSHLIQSIEEEFIDINQLWCGSYLKSNPKKDDDEAQVTVIIRVVQRTETFKSDALEGKMRDYQCLSYGKATHMVEQVVYGAEFILSMQKAVNWPEENIDRVEENIYLAAKNYFDYFMWPNSSCTTTPIELDDISCTILSSLDVGNVVKGSFQLSSQYLKTSINGKDDFEKWQSIEITLRCIPAQIETRIQYENVKDAVSNMHIVKETLNWITKKSREMTKDSFLDQVFPYEKIMCQFRDMIWPLEKVINDFYASLVKNQHVATEKIINHFEDIVRLLLESKDWLINRRRDISRVYSLLKCTPLIMIDLDKLKSRSSLVDQKYFKVLILQVDFKVDPLMTKIQNLIGHSEPKLELPVFPILLTENEDFYEFKNRLESFANEAQLSLNGPSCDSTSFHIGLVTVPSPQYSDGMVITIDNSKSNRQEIGSIDSSTKYDSSQRHFSIQSSLQPSSHVSQQSLVEQENEVTRSTDFETTSENNGDTTTHQHSFTEQTRAGDSTDSKLETTTVADQITASSRTAGLVADNNDESVNPSQSDDQPSEEDADTFYEANECPTKVNEDEECYDQSFKLQLPSNLRIADIFIDEKYKLSQLMITNDKFKEETNVYLINADENVRVGNDLRSFDMGRPNNASHHQHKVIILMGATGCGKSTLINGMFNYILGVKWNDPFRFKVVRDDNSHSDQAYSQTSSVTAYTLHHCNGMAVPYSITIIDTPGYGDTRGVQRDKEITRTIHRFLTQPETQIDQIHAVCFVAASGDSRLTQTQRYILDSVLSIFGRDVKDNIRLLVTFADNADPPVVDACKAAHFPVTSHSAGITYSKFNSSVLYASNQKNDEYDFSFDELFWDMGQENFQKFFEMLEGMNGCDLTSTREVIRRRQQAEKTFKDIENELEECFIRIEETELFQAKMRQYGHKMEANKNFVMEKTEKIPIKIPYKNGFAAYNCNRCQKSCEKSERIKDWNKLKKIRRQCTKELCPCPGSEHAYQKFEWDQKMVKTQTTLLDMKSEYELNSNRKLTTEELLINCQNDLEMARGKVVSLLYKLGENARKLDSTALRSNALSPSDYLRLLRSRVNEEQAPGYLTRLETLTELERYLAIDSSFSQAAASTWSSPSSVTFYNSSLDTNSYIHSSREITATSGLSNQMTSSGYNSIPDNQRNCSPPKIERGSYCDVKATTNANCDATAEYSSDDEKSDNNALPSTRKRNSFKKFTDFLGLSK